MRFIPESVEGHIHMQGYAYDLEWLEKALIYHFLANAVPKKKTKLEFWLCAGALKAYPNFQAGPSANTGRLIGSGPLRKSLSNH